MAKKPRKLRRDATLKKLKEPAKRKLVLEWLEQDGEESARQRIFSELHIASPSDPSKPVSLSTLYDAVNYWAAEEITDEMFSFRDAQEELFKRFRPEDAKLAREFGEFSLLQRANKTQNKDLFTAATMAADMRRRLELDEKSAQTKAEIAKVKLTQKDRDWQLAREKFVTESCEKILQAARDPKIREIVEQEIPNAEKIALIRKAYFADIDALEVELPE